MTDRTTASATPYFRPRRLAHANLWVGNYERSAAFYHEVGGFQEVYRQPHNAASFLSNGNSYHDFGLTDVTSKYASPGQRPGLFHMTFELETEAEMVAAFERAVADQLAFRSTVDHDVAHSLYQYDPDGNIVEFYADVDADWRSHRSGVVTKPKPRWVPGVTSQPVSEPRYPQDPPIERVAEAIFHGRRVAHIGMVARDYPAMLDYYQRVVGLTLLAGGAEVDYAVLRGFVGTGDLTLYRMRNGVAPGMHHVGIEVESLADLAASIDTLRGGRHGGAPRIEREVDFSARHAVTLCDPDGIRLQFFANRDWRHETLEGLAFEDALYLL
ncbi:VOC family protein [Pseudomonas aeruginosa]|uniref:VOC family protein n=1 Tax=Pseudomonas aeruginosa TaxID=287 RepID=UPI003CFF8668